MLGGRIGAQEFRRQVQAAGYPVEAPQMLGVFRLVPKDGSTAGAKLEHIAEAIGKEMTAALRTRECPSMVATSFHQIYVLFAAARAAASPMTHAHGDDAPQEEAAAAASEDLLATLFACAVRHAPVEDIVAGAARDAQLGDLMTLYHHARTAAEIARSLGRHDAPYVYEDGGLAELIIGSSLTEYFQSFARGVLAPLRKEEDGGRSVLLETLAAYLANDGNVLRAADALYVHRNTAKYRLHRIEQILGHPLADPDTRLKLQLAMYIERLLG